MHACQWAVPRCIQFALAAHEERLMYPEAWVGPAWTVIDADQATFTNKVTLSMLACTTVAWWCRTEGFISDADACIGSTVPSSTTHQVTRLWCGYSHNQGRLCLVSAQVCQMTIMHILASLSPGLLLLRAAA